jgi:hypothetical protein
MQPTPAPYQRDAEATRADLLHRLEGDEATRADLLHRLEGDEAKDRLARYTHLLGKGAVCDTDVRGYATPDDRDPADLVLGWPEGVVRLWAQDVTLGWRFQEQSFATFPDPEAVKDVIRGIIGKALLAWGADVIPVRFAERQRRWDFEVVMAETPNCNPMGCTLARAFFPDPGRQELILFPTLFESDSEEKLIRVLCHEIGHTFGLRHFFAQIKEPSMPSVIWGKHNAFTIMNYGEESVLTDDDRADLKSLYRLAWSGELTEINGTPIRLVRPFSSTIMPSPWDRIVSPHLPVVAGGNVAPPPVDAAPVPPPGEYAGRR